MPIVENRYMSGILRKFGGLVREIKIEIENESYMNRGSCITLTLYDGSRIKKLFHKDTISKLGLEGVIREMLEQERYFLPYGSYAGLSADYISIDYAAISSFRSGTSHKIEKVIFNDPATIVIWKDGTKTVVKANDDMFDPEKGLAMAIAKKHLGNKGNYYNEFKKWLPKEESTTINLDPITAEEFARKIKNVLKGV